MGRQQGGQLQQTTGGPGKPVGPQAGMMGRQRMMAQQMRQPPNPTGGRMPMRGGRGMPMRGGGRGGPGRRSMY
jgi:hypothetical protein